MKGPEWDCLPKEQKRLVSSRQGNADASSSNFLWSPTAADCVVDSDSRPESTRYISLSLCAFSNFLLLVYLIHQHQRAFATVADFAVESDSPRMHHV